MYSFMKVPADVSKRQGSRYVNFVLDVKYLIIKVKVGYTSQFSKCNESTYNFVVVERWWSWVE